MDIAFPSELTDAVIDQIHYATDRTYDDWKEYAADQLSHRRALGVCSLVSKSWLPRSRYRLFGSVDLRRHSIKQTLAFIALLEAPLSTIAPYVRGLTLEEGRGRYEHEIRWLNGVLPRLTVLSATESLSVDGARFEMLETEDTTGFFASFKTLKQLHLHSCTFGSYTQVVGALSASPNLEDMTLDFLRILAERDANPFDQLRLEARRDTGDMIGHSESLRCSPLSLLKSLAIGGVDGTADIVKWLTSSTPIPSIGSLRLSVVQASDSRHIADFLRVLGSSLKDLEIGISNNSSASTDSQDAFCRDVDLSYNTKLRSINFNSLAVYDIYMGRAHEGIHVPPILAQITSPSIRKVVISVSMNTTSNLDVLDWSTIERILERPNYSRLQKLIISGVPKEFLEETKTWMKNKLPSCSARGIVECR